MSMQDAKRFIEKTSGDDKLMEEVRAVGIEAGESSAAFFARAAKGFGYDFTAEEIEAELKARQEAAAEIVDGAELDDAELDQVAGGGSCLFSDYCSKLINYKKHNPECKTTYQKNENCYASDDCHIAINSY